MPRVDVEPVRWVPPPPPAPIGPYAPDERLADVERWPAGGRGPEDVVIDADGRVFTGLEDGRIQRFPADGGAPETVVATGGRPLGLEFDAEGRLVVCDADRGLLRLDVASGRLEELVTEFAGAPLRFTNNASVHPDGRIFFTDSSTRWGFEHFTEDLLEHRPTGRLFVHDPTNGTTDLVLDGLYFANGIGRSRDASWLLLAETGAYALSRVWIAGERAGTREVLADSLPGFPDNVADATADGRFWVAIANGRIRQLDALMPHPRLRRVVNALPAALKPAPEPFAMALAVDETGEVVDCLADVRGRSYRNPTGLREHDGWLYLGSLEDDAVARVRLDGPTG